jgi:hypothetical protein
MTIDTRHAATVAEWRAQFQRHREKVRSLCLRHAIHFMDIATSDPMLQALRTGLSRQGKSL